MDTKPIIGLTRHTITEPPGSSLRVVFSEIEKILSKHYTVRRLPVYYPFLDVKQREEIGKAFLQECDLIVNRDLPELFVYREELALDQPVVYLPLGEFPRGAYNFRRTFFNFQPGDAIAFSSLADQEIYHLMSDQCAATETMLPFFADEDVLIPFSIEERQKYRTQFGFNPDDVVFLYVGRITSEKNVHSILSIFQKLVKLYTNVRLLIAGPIDDVKFEEFESGPNKLDVLFSKLLDEDADLKERVKMLPYIDQEALPILYNIADVFMNLTIHHDENFGLTQVEAMSCGTPVIGTNWGGLKDTIQHGKTGFHVDTFVTNWGIRVDLHSAFHYCARLIASREAREEMGNASRQTVLSKFSRSRFEQKLCSIVDECLKTPKNPTDGNQMSRFGLKYALMNAQYDRESEGVITSLITRRPRYTKKNYEFYSKIIHPYSSGYITDEPCAENILSLGTLFYDVKGHAIEMKDPVWARTYEIDSTEKAIIQHLDVCGATKTETLISELGDVRSEAQIKASLRKLLQEGIVVQSSTQLTQPTPNNIEVPQ